MSVDTIATLSGMIVIVGFLWSLHRDISDLRERIARLEGQVQTLASQMQVLMQICVERPAIGIHDAPRGTYSTRGETNP